MYKFVFKKVIRAVDNGAQHLILPVTQGCGTAVPIERELPDDEVRPAQEFLFLVQIKDSVSAGLFQMVHGKSGDARHGIDQRFVRYGVFIIRVRKKNKNIFSHLPVFYIKLSV